MNVDLKLGKTAAVLFLALAMAGCGGGGTDMQAVNTGPSLMLGTGASIDEGETGTTGLTVSATDEQGDEVTFQVDDPRFAVVGGMLTVVAGTMLDYETESSVTVGITASDGELMSDTMTAVVMINNVDDNDPTLSAHGTRGSIIEGQTGGTGVTFTADDNDMLGNLMFSTNVAGFGVIDLGGGRYELEVTQALDREEAASVNVVVTVTDDSGSVMTPTLTIAVGDVDDTAPMLGMSGSGMIEENEEDVDTGVYFTPSDADGDTMFTFAVEGMNRNHFRVVPAGFQYALQVTDAFDYEMSGGTVSVTVAVADSSGMITRETFDVMVEDLNDNAPMITTTGSAAIDEEAMGNTMLMVGATDADTVGDAVMWSVDDSRFTIDADGYLTLNQAINYDGADGEMSVTVMITASDGTLDSTETVTVTINPVNDNAPEIMVDASARMDQMEGTFADATDTGVMVSVTDGDGDMPSPMVDDPRFTIDANGNLMIAAGAMFDYEMMADQSITLTITANDGMNDAEAQTVMVMFTDVNDNAPMLTVTDNQGGVALKVVVRDEGEVSANTPTNHKVVVTDADSHETPPAMVSDSRFMIDENGYLTIVAGSDFNFEDDADKSITLEITADDGENMADPYTITFNIANVDEAPIIEGNRNPELVMGPYGDGNKDVTTLTATDPDNPNEPFVVRWSNPSRADNDNGVVWKWEENTDGDKYTLMMNPGTFLGKGGPAAQSAADSSVSPAVEAVNYTGYTADDAGNLRRHIVDVDDAELDERAIVLVMQKADTITTSSALATYGTYSVDPSKTHVDGATVAEQAMTPPRPGTEMFIPNFDELTDSTIVNTAANGSTPADNRLLDNAEIHAGIARSTLGGTNFANRSPTVYTNATDITNSNIGDAYKTAMVSPANPVPMEPMGLDIVTDTRAVDVSTGAIKTGQELAIRYRFASDGVGDDDGTTVDSAPDYNVDVALIDNSGMVLEEYRNPGDATATPAEPAAYNTTLEAATITASTSSIEVDVSTTSGTGGTGASGDSLNYAKYGLWSYNNLRMCSTCPQGSDGSAGGGLRGATAFGLMARAGDLDTQDHVGVWDGTTVAFWGTKGSDGSIDPATALEATAGLTGGLAKIAVNFNNDKVQANMTVANHRFEFEGMLNADHLGYTASINTTIPGGKGAIVDTGGNNNGVLSAGHTLAVDSANNVHATGMLDGAFYGPTAAVGSTVANAKASAETAGTWQITDVPSIATADKTNTIVIGAFGADLTANTRLDDAANLTNIDATADGIGN